MILIYISILIISLWLSIIIALSPLILGIWILLIALISRVFLAIFSNSWFRIIIFLIYIGGLLVIFAYFISIQPNQFLFIGYNLYILLIFIFTIWLIVDIFKLKRFYNIGYWITGFFDLLNLNILIILGLILFFVIVVVVKICYGIRIPIRPYYNYV